MFWLLGAGTFERGTSIENSRARLRHSPSAAVDDVPEIEVVAGKKEVTDNYIMYGGVCA